MDALDCEYIVIIVEDIHALIVQMKLLKNISTINVFLPTSNAAE